MKTVVIELPNGVNSGILKLAALRYVANSEMTNDETAYEIAEMLKANQDNPGLKFQFCMGNHVSELSPTECGGATMDFTSAKTGDSFARKYEYMVPDTITLGKVRPVLYYHYHIGMGHKVQDLTKIALAVVETYPDAIFTTFFDGKYITIAVTKDGEVDEDSEKIQGQ